LVIKNSFESYILIYYLRYKLKMLLETLMIGSKLTSSSELTSEVVLSLWKHCPIRGGTDKSSILCQLPTPKPYLHTATIPEQHWVTSVSCVCGTATLLLAHEWNKEAEAPETVEIELSDFIGSDGSQRNHRLWRGCHSFDQVTFDLRENKNHDKPRGL
jgi:hypothetical protein